MLLNISAKFWHDPSPDRRALLGAAQVETKHKVSGLLLANHTCVAQLFAKTLTAYDRIRKRNAFVENYRREPMFSENLDEFDDSRDVVASLRDEYTAAESPDYVDWGLDDDTETDAGGLLAVEGDGGAFASDEA